MMRNKSVYKAIKYNGEMITGTVDEVAKSLGLARSSVYNACSKNVELEGGWLVFREKPIYYFFKDGELIDSDTDLTLLCVANGHDYRWAKRNIFEKVYKGEVIRREYICE